jgi:hypothetical protein
MMDIQELIDRLQGHVKTLHHVASSVYSDDISEAIDALEKLYVVYLAADEIKPLSANYKKDNRVIYWNLCSKQYKKLKEAVAAIGDDGVD